MPASSEHVLPAAVPRSKSTTTGLPWQSRREPKRQARPSSGSQQEKKKAQLCISLLHWVQAGRQSVRSTPLPGLMQQSSTKIKDLSSARAPEIRLEGFNAKFVGTSPQKKLPTRDAISTCTAHLSARASGRSRLSCSPRHLGAADCTHKSIRGETAGTYWSASRQSGRAIDGCDVGVVRAVLEGTARTLLAG